MEDDIDLVEFSPLAEDEGQSANALREVAATETIKSSDSSELLLRPFGIDDTVHSKRASVTDRISGPECFGLVTEVHSHNHRQPLKSYQSHLDEREELHDSAHRQPTLEEREAHSASSSYLSFLTSTKSGKRPPTIVPGTLWPQTPINSSFSSFDPSCVFTIPTVSTSTSNLSISSLPSSIDITLGTNTNANIPPFQLGTEVFLAPNGQSISWVCPNLSVQDVSLHPQIHHTLLSLHSHTRSYEQCPAPDENWFRKCNIYTVHRILPSTSSHSASSRGLYDLIPEVGDDGTTRIPTATESSLILVVFKPGDIVQVQIRDGGDKVDWYKGTIGQVWVENGRRRYRVSSLERGDVRGVKEPREEDIVLIHRPGGDVRNMKEREKRGKEIKEKCDRFMTALLRRSMQKWQSL